jgi:hypothetical protein
MVRIVTTDNPSQEAARYLRHYMDDEFVEERVQRRHPTLTAALRRRKARGAALAIRQGLEYLDSAAVSAVLTKPLPLFYAAENLTKALLLVQDPLLEPSDFKAHGLSGDKTKKRYSVKNLTCAVQKAGSDVWSRVFAALNGDRVRVNVTMNGQGISRDWWDSYATPAAAPKSTLQLGDLLRRLPELTDDLLFARWKPSYMVHLSGYMLVHNDGPPPSDTATLTFRHGHDPETKAMVVAGERRKDLLLGWTKTQDTLDILTYTKSVTGVPLLVPEMRLDAFGEIYMEFETKKRLGELVVDFAALFILSDVVRYQVDQWKRLLDDHPSEELLVERFLQTAARKLPNLVLNELGGELYEFKFSR